ncbi:MAG: hypothetical protein EPO13_08700 [Actinomycetota bacterium]|nr:MAG: hypothetical protein EPO13_08700 [Actinomycetota bacterium]
MLAVTGTLPTDPSRWSYELKWDGLRIVAGIDVAGIDVAGIDVAGIDVAGAQSAAAVRLVSRNGRDVSVSFPEVVQALTDWGRRTATSAVLDGEIVATGPAGTPDFGLLQERMHVADPARAATLARRIPLTYLVFDVLQLGGVDLCRTPYDDRRDVLDGLGLAGGVQVPPRFAGSAQAALDFTREHGLEGVIAKRRDASYRPGVRSDAWVKTRHLQTQDVVVGGWTAGTGGRSTDFGALLVGVPDGDLLRYVGAVGTGWTDAALRATTATLAGLATPSAPFRELPAAVARSGHWVRPVLRGEVSFSGWTRDGRLRHPVWRGFRPDL